MAVAATAALASAVMVLDDEPVLVARARSAFGELFVVDRDGLRSLHHGSPDGPRQSVIDLKDPGRLVMPYLRPVALVAAIEPRPRSALLIGLGGGGFVHYLRHHSPETAIDAVEIDPVVLELAGAHFGITADTRLALHLADGAEFLRRPRSGPGYDLIFLDAYQGDEIPAALATAAFFATVRDALAPGGRVVANVATKGRAAFIRTFAAAFGNVCRELQARQDYNVAVLGGSPVPRGAIERTALFLDGAATRRWRFATIARTYRPCGGEPAPRSRKRSAGREHASARAP